MEILNHCQICEREIKSRFGLIAHHGYRRPESGWQTESCIGARNLPYEESRDVIPKALIVIENFIKLKELQIELIKKDNPPVPFIRTTISSDNPMYKVRQEEHINRLGYEIKIALRDKERLQKRYDNWIKKEVLK